jgi:RNA polymerase sigma factor (sigma-70 family)
MVERAHAEIRRRGDDGVVVSFEDRVDATDSMHAALLKLPVDQRAVIVLRHLEDLSEQETARLLGIRPGTVKSRLARGLGAMRAGFADAGHDAAQGTDQEAP